MPATTTPQNNPYVLVDTKRLSEDVWLEYRRCGIDGSDAASILGVSPFKTARDLYYDKLKIVSYEDPDDNWVQKKMGHLLEDIDMLAVENNIRRIGEMIMADSAHFEYIKRCEESRQISIFGDWGWIPMEFPRTQVNDKRKLLMKIPDNARLITNGCEMVSRSRYFMGSEKNIYIFLEEIDAAVESEYSFAITIDGEALSYDPKSTRKTSILTMEEAIERLSNQ